MRADGWGEKKGDGVLTCYGGDQELDHEPRMAHRRFRGGEYETKKSELFPLQVKDN